MQLHIDLPSGGGGWEVGGKFAKNKIEASKQAPPRAPLPNPDKSFLAPPLIHFTPISFLALEEGGPFLLRPQSHHFCFLVDLSLLERECGSELRHTSVQSQAQPLSPLESSLPS